MSYQALAQAGGRELGDVHSKAVHAAEGAVFKLASSVSQLKRLVEQLGTPKDTVTLRQRLADANAQTQSLARSIKDQLTGLLETSNPASTPVPAATGGSSSNGSSSAASVQQQAAQSAKARKLLQDFAGILTDFKATQKSAADREAQSLPKPAPAPPPSKPNLGSNANGTELDLEAGTNYERQALLQHQQQQQQQAKSFHLDNAIQYNEALIEERDQGIAEIQRQIGEVNEMFQDLAVLVNDQGHQVLTIDTQIVATAERVTDAKKELVSANRSQRAGANKCLWIALVLAVVVSIILIILLA